VKQEPWPVRAENPRRSGRGEVNASYVAPDGTAFLTREDLLVVLGSLSDAAHWLAYRLDRCKICRSGQQCSWHRDALTSVAAYARLARVLGRDR